MSPRIKKRRPDPPAPAWPWENVPLFLRWLAVSWLIFSLISCATIPPLTPTEKAALREAAIVGGSKLVIALASGALTRF